MPTALKGWTRAEYDALSEQRLELVDGELISKAGKQGPHVICLTLFMEWLVEVFGVRFVRPSAPIDVARKTIRRANRNRIFRLPILFS